MRKTTIPIAVIGLSLLLPGFAAAQDVTPGSVIEPIDRPVIQPGRAQTGNVSRETGTGTSPAAAGGPTVRVAAIVIRGNTLFDDGQLQALIADRVGRDLTIAQIYEIADEIERFYRDNGYLLTSVFLPAQRVQDGNILLEVIEGKLGALVIDGELSSYDERFLLRQLDRIELNAVIDDSALESEALLLDDLPGLDARAVIRAGQDYGTSDVYFLVAEDRVEYSLGLTNHGRETIGEYRFEAGMLIANPLLQGDALNLSLITTDSGGMTYWRADYDLPVNRSGSRAGIGIAGFDYDVDTDEIAALAGQSLGGEGQNLALTFSHPIRRSARASLYLDLALRHSETEESGSAALAPGESDGIDLFDLSLTWNRVHRDYSTSTLSASLASNFQSRDDLDDTDSQAGKLTLSAAHWRPFADHWFMSFALQLVDSPDPLVDIERFRIGGPGNVRAYPAAEFAGDKGRLIGIEIGRRIALGAVPITARAFYDRGEVERIEPVGEADDDSLAGIGLGLDATFAGRHQLTLEAASPTSDHDASDGEDARFWFAYRVVF